MWHVQATLKPGQRHIYSKRDFFIDEDAWYGGFQETYDGNGKIYRVLFHGIAPSYDIPAPAQDEGLIHDLVSGVYTFISLGSNGVVNVTPMKASELTPESMTSRLLRY